MTSNIAHYLQSVHIAYRRFINKAYSHWGSTLSDALHTHSPFYSDQCNFSKNLALQMEFSEMTK